MEIAAISLIIVRFWLSFFFPLCDNQSYQNLAINHSLQHLWQLWNISLYPLLVLERQQSEYNQPTGNLRTDKCFLGIFSESWGLQAWLKITLS